MPLGSVEWYGNITRSSWIDFRGACPGCSGFVRAVMHFKSSYEHVVQSVSVRAHRQTDRQTDTYIRDKTKKKTHWHLSVRYNSVF